MPRFFLNNIKTGSNEIEGEDAKHLIKVLRVKIGEKITICDGKKREAEAVVQEIQPQRVLVRVEGWTNSLSEADFSLHLYQALPKGDKLELIVQKAVELGVTEITPVLTKRCVSRPDEKSMMKKQGRLQKIALEAAKQSGRGIIPEVNKLLNYTDAVNQMRQDDLAILFYEAQGESLKDLLKVRREKISILIGSEGGFEEGEAEQAEQAGLRICNLGKRILRCETAPLCAVSAIMYATGNL